MDFAASMVFGELKRQATEPRRKVQIETIKKMGLHQPFGMTKEAAGNFCAFDRRQGLRLSA
jgi:hypothetical protein